MDNILCTASCHPHICFNHVAIYIPWGFQKISDEHREADVVSSDTTQVCISETYEEG